MPRPFVFSLAAGALAALGCAKPPVEVTHTDPPVPAPRAALPVAPMPHLPRERVLVTTAERAEEPVEKDLTNDDLGIDPKIGAALPEIERFDQKTVDEKVIQDNIGLPPDNIGHPSGSNPSLYGGSTNGGPLTTLAGRTGSTKSRLLKDGGGNAESELAVVRGLAWLAKQQRKDGSWAFDVGAKDETAAATGLALLPFLGAGETHKKGTKYQTTVNAGVQWLVKDIITKDKDAGRFAGAKTSYGQAIATLALVEAYGLTRDPALKDPAQAAVNYVQWTQAANGSWPADDEHGATSLVGWQVQALKAAKLTKELKVDDKVLQKAAAFLDATAAGARKAMYGSTDKTDAAAGTGPTAAGLLCRYYISEWGPVHPGMIDGVGGLMKTPPAGTGAVRNMYYYYHATQVVHFFEGEDWKTWNEGAKTADGTRKGGMRDWLITTQTKKDINLGSWEPEAGWFGMTGGRVATTAVCLLTLEVYYRHLPLYKRGADGNAVKVIE